MGPPAGGPEDKVPPKLIGTVPESLGSYPAWRQDVEFRFDEVVSEGGSPNLGLGTGDLEKLVLLSPSRSVPVIRWKRNRITVHPKEGWQPNRVYRVELLPGLTDLRRNRTDTATVLTFSTGGPAPTDTLAGIVIDWVAGKVAPAALVELLYQTDSLIYRTVTDSSGRYQIGPLPRGQWTVFGALDQNKNLRREGREHYDSALVAEAARRIPALWLIPRDSVGPRILSITPNDSVSATIQFSQPLDPQQHLDSVVVRFLRLPDSIPTPFKSLRLKTVDDSLQKAAQARADSARAATDSLRPDSLPSRPPALPAPKAPGRPDSKPAVADPEADSLIASRPRLTDRLVLRVDSAFVPETRFVLEVSGIRSAAGVAGDAKAGLQIPKPKPVPKSETPERPALPADSLVLPPSPPPPKPR